MEFRIKKSQFKESKCHSLNRDYTVLTRTEKEVISRCLGNEGGIARHHHRRVRVRVVVEVTSPGGVLVLVLVVLLAAAQVGSLFGDLS